MLKHILASLTQRHLLARTIVVLLILGSLSFYLSYQALHSTNISDCQMQDGENECTSNVSEQEGGSSDYPEAAQDFRRLQLQNEIGVIPPDAMIRAVEQITQMEKVQIASPQGAGISRGNWSWLGPGNTGGRIRAIVIHPTNPATMWLASASGGIWKTTDSGSTWFPLDDFMSSLFLSTLIIDPTNANILYAGTGEYFGVGPGAGIFKTADGGTTWTQIPSTANFNFSYVNRLAISPNGTTLLAATSTGFWRSTDSGVTWTQVISSVVGFDVTFHPTESNRAIAGAGGGQAWYSTNGGQTWAPSSGLPSVGSGGWVELAYARSNPLMVYASVDRNNGEIWKSTDGGGSFSFVSTNTGGGWGYANALWVSPTDPNRILIGAVFLYRSTDGGSTFTAIPGDTVNFRNFAYVDQHAFVEPPGYDGVSNKIVYVGNDGGIFRTDDISATPVNWYELNNNLGITQFYGAAGNTTTGVILGGTQDMGTWRYTGGTENWNMIRTNDGGFCAADPTDPNYFYGEIQWGNIFRAPPGGVSGVVDFISGFVRYSAGGEVWKNAPYVITDARDKTTNFITPFVLDLNNPNRILFGGKSLWRSNDVKAIVNDNVGPSWEIIKSPTADNSFISAILVVAGNSDIVWVGHNNGDIYKTTNGTSSTPTWTRIDTNAPGLPNRMVTRLAIDPTDSNIVYATFGGFSPDNVWRTTNGGMTWTDITGSGMTGLPDIPVYSLAIHPQQSNWIYAGTELGVFASENAGQSWIVPHDGPNNAQVRDLFWMGINLVAATHGRGVYRQTVYTTLPKFIYLPLIHR